jgi:hypothetical protein
VSHQPPSLSDLESVALVPVGGVVTLNHKPLAKAVVMFMPRSGATSVGETDKDGRYNLESHGRRRGAPAGDYKVAISYFVSADGEPQDLAARSSMVQTPGMGSAKEQLPREYSDLGRTKLRARVGSEGGTFDFDIEAPDVVVPKVDDKEEADDGPG